MKGVTTFYLCFKRILKDWLWHLILSMTTIYLLHRPLGVYFAYHYHHVKHVLKFDKRLESLQHFMCVNFFKYLYNYNLVGVNFCEQLKNLQNHKSLGNRNWILLHWYISIVSLVSRSCRFLHPTHSRNGQQTESSQAEKSVSGNFLYC